MQPPDTLPDEEERLAELERLQLLDTPADERFDRITRLARRALGTDIALVSLVDAGRQWFKSAQGLAAPETTRDISFCGHAICGEGTLVVPDARRDERFHDNPLVTGGPNIRLYAGQPIRGPAGHPIGTLCVIDSTPRELGEEELGLLRDLATLVEHELRFDSLRLSEQELRRHLGAAERKASIDPLTRLWNRDSIFRLLDLELERAASARGDLGVAMVDIDHFKQVNDSHGHPVGDEVLASVAERIRAALRDTDLVGRYGGEEFLVVLGADAATRVQVAERVRQRVTATPVPSAAGPLKVTVSIGVSGAHPVPSAARDVLIGEADRALYVAKEKGRDRVEVWGGTR